MLPNILLFSLKLGERERGREQESRIGHLGKYLKLLSFETVKTNWANFWSSRDKALVSINR